MAVTPAPAVATAVAGGDVPIGTAAGAGSAAAGVVLVATVCGDDEAAVDAGTPRVRIEKYSTSTMSGMLIRASLRTTPAMRCRLSNALSSSGTAEWIVPACAGAGAAGAT